MFILFEVILVLLSALPLLILARKIYAGGGVEKGGPVARRLLVFKIIFASVLFAVIAWNIYLAIYVDWHWFASKGYMAVFKRILGLQWAMFLVAFPLSFAFVFINLKFAFAGIRRKSSDTEVALGSSLLVALLIGGSLTTVWSDWLLAKHQVVSEITDPVFGRSISYYLFSLPWKIDLLSMFTGLFLITFLILLGWFLSR